MQEEEVEEENRLSEEAERRFERQTPDPDQPPHTQEQPEGTSSFVNMTFELEQETPGS